ncbi:hypothetical protein [Oricola sp.]|uniref:hypothetical protein n=1 Tax=Oricola sp. TaxID=1979950 RepID=UPI0035126F01
MRNETEYSGNFQASEVRSEGVDNSDSGAAQRKRARSYSADRNGNFPYIGSVPHSGHVEAAILDLAARIDRLSPDRRNPEAFHVEKDEIAQALRKIAQEGR